MSAPEQHPLQPLLDATQPYIAAVEKMTASFNAAVALINELKEANAMLLDAHNQLLVAAGLKVDDSVPFAIKEQNAEQATNEFLETQDKESVHAAIKMLAENGKSGKLKEILAAHNFIAAGDTPATVKHKIDSCENWQKVRALLNDLMAVKI